jgi:hypothetical protein
MKDITKITEKKEGPLMYLYNVQTWFFFVIHVVLFYGLL